MHLSITIPCLLHTMQPYEPRFVEDGSAADACPPLEATPDGAAIRWAGPPTPRGARRPGRGCRPFVMAPALVYDTGCRRHAGLRGCSTREHQAHPLRDGGGDGHEGGQRWTRLRERSHAPAREHSVTGPLDCFISQNRKKGKRSAQD